MSTKTEANDTPKQDFKLKAQEIGALWTSKSGNPNYLGGHILNKDGKEVKIFLLKNKFCEDPKKHPTWRIYVDTENRARPSESKTAKPESAPAPTAKKKVVKKQEPTEATQPDGNF